MSSLVKFLAPLVRRAVLRVPASVPGDTHAPLLNEAELRDIIQCIQRTRAADRSASDVQHRYSGDFRSAYLGRGLDFEEARPYQHGDDTRDMDWRTTARTGKPYLKVYREEHQRALHLLVDRRAGMRFGTRGQLKVTQAARIAAMFAFGAARSNAVIGGTLWQPDRLIVPGLSGETGAMRLVQAAITPCPPLQTLPEAQSPALSGLLRRLDAELPAGSRVMLISDFAGMEEADLPQLMRFAARHEIRAIQVLDPAECELPDVGRVRFKDIGTGKTGWLHSGGRSVRMAFRQDAAARHEAQRVLLTRVGVRLHRCMTDEDAFGLWQAWRQA